MRITQRKLESVDLKTDGKLIIDSYNETDYNLLLGEQRAFYCNETFEYIKSNNDWGVALHIKDAIEKRMNGIRALTLREFDTCARSRIDLYGAVGTALMLSGSGYAVIEGITGLVNDGISMDPWKLRNLFNRGLNWILTKKGKQNKFTQDKGMKDFNSIKQRLDELGLRLWPKEVNHGVHVELTKPEFMTWDQYKKKLQCKVSLV